MTLKSSFRLKEARTDYKAMRILLVHPCREMGERLRSAASAYDMTLLQTESLAELGAIGFLRSFDLIVVASRDTDHLNGLDIARYVDALLPDMPVILLAEGGEKHPSHPQIQPRCISNILSENEDPNEVINVCCAAFSPHHSREKPHKAFAPHQTNGQLRAPAKPQRAIAAQAF